MRSHTIFLASSSELVDDRDRFEIFISRKNDQLVKENIFLNLIRWENFLDAMSRTRLQDEYNKAVTESDIFIMLFFTKVGKYTEEEFDNAFKKFKEAGRPQVFTYFKNANVLSGDLGEEFITLLQFKKKLSDLGHYLTHYTNIDNLENQFDEQLDKLIATGFIKPDTANDNSVGPCRELKFEDKTVNEGLQRLCMLHQQMKSEFLPEETLLSEFDLLFNRNTFRFEKTGDCTEQRWADRLHSAYQTLQLLEFYTRNIRQVAPTKYSDYQKLLREVSGYCMQMGTLLFEPSVDYNVIEPFIGKTSFKDHLPKKVDFPTRPGKKPIIPADINDPIENHRENAVALMNQLVGQN